MGQIQFLGAQEPAIKAIYLLPQDILDVPRLAALLTLEKSKNRGQKISLTSSIFDKYFGIQEPFFDVNTTKYQSREAIQVLEGKDSTIIAQYIEKADPSETNECKSGRDTSSTSKKEE